MSKKSNYLENHFAKKKTAVRAYKQLIKNCERFKEGNFGRIDWKTTT